MAQTSSKTDPAAARLRQAGSLAILAAILVFVAYTAWAGLTAAFDNEDFPESLAVKVELLPLVFPVHMVTGALALVLLPLAIALRHRPRHHRLVGRIAAADVLIAGLTAYPVALVAPVTAWSAAGFTAQATVWLILLFLGVGFARQRRIAEHWTCMLLMLAATSGAVFFRVFLALWAIFGTVRQFEAFYALDAWIAWLLPLSVTALVLRLRACRAAAPLP